MDSSSQVHSILYEYSFLHPISDAVMSCLAGIMANEDLEHADHVCPIIAWQTGVVRISGPITLGLQLVKPGLSVTIYCFAACLKLIECTKLFLVVCTYYFRHFFPDASGTSLTLQAQAIKSSHSDDDLAMIKCLWNQLEFYRLPLEYALHKLGFYYSFKVNVILLSLI